MSTQALEKTETTVPTSTASAARKTTSKPEKEPKAPKPHTGWRRLAPRNQAGGVSVVVWAGFFRAVVLLADYLLACITAVVIIPLLGAWLHQQSGASRVALSADGTIAMWLVPLLFLVALLVAGEIVVMRGMWRWATRMIAKIQNARGDVPGTHVTPESTTRTAHQSRANRKRSN
ncbi:MULTISPECIES: hypothetical protein [Streptomyces]|uniref:hypothetical protein n=1 Tax=Streptomyces TaxID=1883 RepID=UPI00167230A6|nr:MULTISPECIES: hypothetical protein [Streptomyces]MBD3578797.1 hypothetical protein [Streptomyces sp. KD18]GGS80615.1 hypothetical protein GCM10010286_01410 [Streptomyces toxytricini]